MALMKGGNHLQNLREDILKRIICPRCDGVDTAGLGGREERLGAEP
jgi:hypothetical protein